MPRGRPRKSAKAEASADEPDTKRVKLELDGSKFRWEWEDDKIKKWVQYSSEVSDAICEAFTKNQPEVLLDIGSGVVMRVVVEKMVQKNKATGWEKRIRCCKKDGSDYCVWEWEDELGNWNPYAVNHQMELWESTSDQVALSVLGRNYDVDKAKLTQTNRDTGVVRNVRFTKSDANSPVPGAKILPSTGASSAGASSESGSSGARSGRGRPRAAKSGGKGDVKEEEEEEEEAPPTKSKAKSGKSGRNREKEAVRTVVVKAGSAPVDPECEAKVGVAHVYTEGKDIYDVMLNQTNLQNNNNKFFIIQLLEDDGKKSYSVWFRWGRVGYSGQNNLVPCGPNLDEAKKVFCKKFSEKTKNDWADRKSFQKVAGKYDLVEIDYSVKNNAKVEDAVDGPSKSLSVPSSKLDKKLQDLINLICDVKTMEDVVMEMKYDARKAPLGKLTSQQVKAGYSALKEIEKCINKNDFGQRLTNACNDFYTRIPHDFGFQRPPTIRTVQELKQKISLLEALADIEVAMKLLKQGSSDENPIDSHYKSLDCGLTPLDCSDADFKMIEDYVQNTHASTHNQYKMKVLDVFSTKKSKLEADFTDYGNRMLLWHGSRLTNWMGILSQGLRIAPPEAPVTGYMFGKGVYFADMSSKSANYCYASRSKNVGLLLLCEVSLGTPNDLLAADYQADKLPKGKHSVRGLGRTAPDPKDNFTMPDGVVVPLGKGKPTGITSNSLFYNEFIVYKTQQIKLRYLVKVRFDFR